jgi:hypothetical protein
MKTEGVVVISVTLKLTAGLVGAVTRWKGDRICRMI